MSGVAWDDATLSSCSLVSCSWILQQQLRDQEGILNITLAQELFATFAVTVTFQSQD